VKKDIQNRLRASVQAEDRAVKERFSSVEALIEKPKKKKPKKASGSSGVRTSSKVRDLLFTDGPAISREDAQVIRRVRDRLLKQGITLSKSELALAGFYALLRSSDDEILETVHHLRKGKKGRPVFSSGRGSFRLSRLD